MCDIWKRKGQLCGECKDGYAPQVYSFDFRCVPCDPADVYINLVKYGLTAFSGPTIFLLLLLCLRVQITTAKLNAFILVCQCTASPYVITNTYSIGVRCSYDSLIHSNTCTNTLCMLQIRTSFEHCSICLNINTWQALLRLAFYPLILLIWLYERKCRVVLPLETIPCLFCKMLQSMEYQRISGSCICCLCYSIIH